MKQKGIVGIFVLLILALAIAGGVYYLGKISNRSQKSQAILSNFFLRSVPRSVSDISILNLPNTADIKGVVSFKDSLWFSGGGSLVEYDIKSGKLISYSDLIKANCDSNVVMANNSLFTACRTDNINDAFGHTEQLTSKVFTGHYSIFKINPSAHEVEYIFTDKDGLKNRYNFKLTGDGDTVWVETFKGIGRIDAKTNKVSFYTTPEIDIAFGIGKILPDRDYVWAWSADEGLALFNRSAQTWQQFADTDVLGKPVAFRLDARPFASPIKLVSGGLQIGLWAGEDIGDNCLVRQYNYSTQQWTTVSSQQTQYVYQCGDILKQQFPQEPTYTIVDTDGLVQIRLPETGEQYQVDGRNNYTLSPVVDNKRYILTNSTIDVIDNTLPFPQILVKLGSLPSGSTSYSDPAMYEDLVNFLVDPDRSFAVVVDPDCAGQGCMGGQKAWLVDLNAGKVNKVYTKADNLPEGDLLYGLSMSREGDLLVVKDKQGEPLFNINTSNYNLSFR